MKRSWPLLVWGFLAFLAFSPTPAEAQEEVEKRPYVQLLNEYFLTGSVYPQERGELQLTLLPSFESGEDTRSRFPLSIEFGITDRWQIEAEWDSFVSVKPESGPRQSAVGDLEFSTQYSFMAIGGSSFHAALGFGMTFPTGDLQAGTTEGLREYEPSIVVAKDFQWGGGAQLFGQAALGFVQRTKHEDDASEAEPDAHEFSLNGGILIPLGDARLTTEVNWTTNTWNNEGDEKELYLTPGLTWNLPGTWEVGVGAPLGVTADADDMRLILILLYEFEPGDEGSPSP